MTTITHRFMSPTDDDDILDEQWETKDRNRDLKCLSLEGHLDILYSYLNVSNVCTMFRYGLIMHEGCNH